MRSLAVWPVEVIQTEDHDGLSTTEEMATGRARRRPGARHRGDGECADATRGGDGAPYTPAAGAKDLKAVLFNWMWGMGMLKGTDERDMVATLEYQGKGTIQVDGQPCTLTTVPRQHQLPVLQSAHSVRLHAAERADVLEHRGRQRAATPGTKTDARRRDRRDEGKHDADADSRAGAADSHLGQSPGRGQGGARRDHASEFWLGANPGTLFADGVGKVSDTSVSWEHGQAGRHVPHSRRARARPAPPRSMRST